MPVPCNASLEQAMPVPYNSKYQNLHDFSDRLLLAYGVFGLANGQIDDSG